MAGSDPLQQALSAVFDASELRDFIDEPITTDLASRTQPVAAATVPEQQPPICPQPPAANAARDGDGNGDGEGDGDRDRDGGGRTDLDPPTDGGDSWTSPASTPDTAGAENQPGRPRFLSLDPGEVYEAFDGQRSGLLKPSQLARRVAPAKRPTPPPDYLPTDWHGLTRKEFLWSRFSDEDRRLVLQTPRGRRRSVPTAEPKCRNDNFEAAFHKFQELGRPRAARGRGRPAGSRPPPPALVPIWLPGGLNAAARRFGSGESRTSSNGTPEGSPLHAAAIASEQRSFRSDGSGSGSGCGSGSGSGSDHVFPMESPEPERESHRRLSPPSSLSRVRLVPAGPGSHLEVGSAAAEVSPAVPRPASVPPQLPVSSTQQHSATDEAQRSATDVVQGSEADTPMRSEVDRNGTDHPSSDPSMTFLPELRTPPAPPQTAPTPQSLECDSDKASIGAASSPARTETGDIEIGLEEDERHSVGEDSDGHAEEESAGEDERKSEEKGEEGNGRSIDERAENDAEGGERPPPPPRRRVQVERHNSEVHLRLSRSSEEMIRQLERVQYEPGQTDEDGVELRKKKPKSFRRKLKEVLRRAKEDEALLQDFTEYLVVVRPDKMILKRVGDVAREEPPPPTRASRGRGGRHHGQRRPHTTSVGPDDVFCPRQTTELQRNDATLPAMPWGDADEEVPFSPRYAADGSPASSLSAVSKGTVSEGGSSPSRESLVEFISRHSQRPRLEAHRRRRPTAHNAAKEMEVEGSTILPPLPPSVSPGQSHDSQPPNSEKLTGLPEAQGGGKETGRSSGQDRGQLNVEGSDQGGNRTPQPPPPPTSSPVQSPDSTQAGEHPPTGYDVSRYTESITPPAPGDENDGQQPEELLSGPTQPPVAECAGIGYSTVEDEDKGACSETNVAQADIKESQVASEMNEEEAARNAPPIPGQTQLQQVPEPTPAVAVAVPKPAPTPEAPPAPLSPPNVTITRVSRPPRPPSSPPSEASRQPLKRPSSAGQTLPLKKRRLETAEQKSQRSRLLEAACGPQTEDLPRRAHHLDMALVKGYEFLFQPASEEHAITRVLNPSYEPSLAMAEPPRPGAGQRQLSNTGTQQSPQQHLQQPQHQRQPYIQHHHQQQPQQQQQRQQRKEPQQQQQSRSHRSQAAGSQSSRGQRDGSGASAAGRGAARQTTVPVQPHLPPPPPPAPFAAPYPLPMPAPHAMSPSVHALFEAYERASRRRPEPRERRAFRLYEPGGQERHRQPLPPPPAYGAGWQQHLQMQQQQQQMELHHQQWLQQSHQERHYQMQREHQQAQQQHQQQLQQQHQQQLQQQHHLQQLQHQKQQQQQMPHPHHDSQMQLHHQLQPYQHYQQHHSQHQQQHEKQQQRHHQPSHQQAQQHTAQPQQQQQPPQLSVQSSGPTAALASSWGSIPAWCPEDPATGRGPASTEQSGPHRPAACYPCPEYPVPGLRRHVYPSLGEPWAPVDTAGWPPRPGAS